MDRAPRAYFEERAAERRAQPRDDLISELVQTEVDGQRLTDDDIFAFLILLLPAGIETTYRSLGNLLFALLTHPDQLDEAVENPELRASAIEEGLRWETPLLMIPRRSVRERAIGRRRRPGGPRPERLHRIREPRRAPLRRARPLRHPPRAGTTYVVRVGAAHVPRHAPRPHGDPRRARRDTRTPARPSPRSRSGPAQDRRQRLPIAEHAPRLLYGLSGFGLSADRRLTTHIVFRYEG